MRIVIQQVAQPLAQVLMEPVRVAGGAVDRRLLKADPVNGEQTGQTVTHGCLLGPR